MENIFYPKQINRAKIRISENQCFFAMPFSPEYRNLYDTLSLHLENSGYKCVRVDKNLSASVPIINLILNGIATSQYIIVDISETNANVFYELGVTHTIKEYENVFIIKEQSKNTPFDIQHLQYISYDKNNLKELANELLKRLKANQFKNSFKRALSEKQFLKMEDIDEFVSYFSKLFSEEQILIYTSLLENSISLVAPSLDAINAIWQFDRVLRNEMKKAESENYIPILFRIFFELLLSCCRSDEVRKFVNEFLNSKEYGELYGNAFLPYQTDLAIKLAENSKLNEISLKWIIEYFQRSKSTKVDLNRYKLEAFLLKTDLEKVDEYITNALICDNQYVREHLADIAGEKMLYIAEDNLITQLKREQNKYTVSSIVEALGKIHSQKSIDTMHDWLNTNATEVIEKGDYFVLKHFRNALIKIAPENVMRKFDDNYLELLVKNKAI